MYRTRNYLQRKHINPVIRHGNYSHSPEMANPYAAGEKFHCDDRSAMCMNCTVPDDTSTQEIHRTGSGGFFLRRKRSDEEQRILSRQRAAALIAQYEMSDNKEKSLNRKVAFGPPPLPSLGSCLGARQTALASYYENRTTSSNRRKREEPDRGCKGDKAVASKALRPPLKAHGNTFTFEEPTQKTSMKKMTRGQQRIEIARATRMRLEAERAAKADVELPCEMGMDVLPISPGVYSAAPTVASTPSPRSPPCALPEQRLPSLRATQQIHRLC